jgi:hypothetical protein
MCQGCLIETEMEGLCGSAPHRFAGESELGELLHDPIARALMAADKVDSSEIYALLRKVQGRGFSSDSVQ